MIIYKITNTINNKSYIGQSIHDLGCRKSQHLYDVRKGCEYLIHKAMRKYGENSFIWEVLCECNTKQELSDMEMYYISHYNTYYGNGQGYNMTLGGGNTKPISDESRLKMSLSKRGDKSVNYGKQIPHLIDWHKNNPNPMTREDVKAKHRKIYKAYDINNNEYIIDNIITFCEENNLNKNTMYVISFDNKKEGIFKRHKGWYIILNDDSKSLQVPPLPTEKVYKKYTLITPENITIEVSNLRQFCKDNNLLYSSMKNLCSGKVKSNKGWTISPLPTQSKE